MTQVKEVGTRALAREEVCALRALTYCMAHATKQRGRDAPALESDAAVVARSVTQPEAFATISDRHFDAVHRYVHRRAGRDVADEVAAETFTVAFPRRERWSRTAPDARPWLLGIATNLLRRYRRVESRRLRALAAGEPDAWSAFDESRVLERADAAAAVSTLAGALARLPRRDRDAVALVGLGDLTYAQAGAALGVPPGTIASRVNRARRTLALALHEQEENDVRNPL